LHSGRADRPGTVEHSRRRAGRPDEGLDARRDLEVRSLAANARELPCVKPVPGKFDQGVRVASGAWSIVVGAGATGKRIERSTQGCSANRVEESLDEERASFVRTHVERAVFHVPQLLSLERLDVVCMASMCAVDSEATQRVTHRLVEEWLLIERRRRRRLLKGPRRPSHQREVRKAELSLLDSRDGFREPVSMRANGDCVRRRHRGHPTLETYPMRGAQTTLPLLLFGCGKGASHRRELQLDAIDDSAKANQIVA
jgi:hypothetical protein